MSLLSKTQATHNNASNSVAILSNVSVKHNFYSTLSFWANKVNTCDASAFAHLIGKRSGFGIINTEHHLDMLKNASSFLKELGKINGKILFVNNQLTNNLDGIVKFFAIYSGQLYSIEKWNCGRLTMGKNNLEYNAIVVLNPSKNLFLICEAQKLGIPIISLYTGESSMTNLSYPIICNNESSDSVTYVILIIANAIIYGQLYQTYTSWYGEKNIA
jgi:ribosomal protein S2